MKLWVLAENTKSRPDVTAEHGLSLYLETEGHRILVDMGQTGAFADNARTMGVDLGQVDVAVLSHGHYDHGGGLRRFLEENQMASVYVSADAFGAYYHGPEKYVGLDPALAAEPRLRFVRGDLRLDEELSLLTLGREPAGEAVDDDGLQERREGVLQPDRFLHEQYLLIRDKGRTCLISGCSHRGAVNIAAHFQPDHLIGGLHFRSWDPAGEAGREKLEAAAEKLLQTPCFFWTCHCTGVPQYRYLRERMGDRIRYLSTGDVVEI